LVSRAIWVGLCTCPGTELAEARLAEAEREAWEATRAAAPGNGRAQIRELYVAELRARGLSAPSDLVLDATADAIARNREKFSVAYSARVLGELGRGFGKLFSRFGTDA
jgi:hypothetical protein